MVRMIEKNEMDDNSGARNGYISCIKINGIPILPPLITHQRRKELLNYKRQALHVEKLIKYERELKSYIDEFCPSFSKSTETVRNDYSTLEQQISFSDNSHIDALDIPEASVKRNQKLPSITDVPSSNNKIKTTNVLTRCIIDVLQYSDEGMILFKNENESSKGSQQLESKRCDSTLTMNEDILDTSYHKTALRNPTFDMLIHRQDLNSRAVDGAFEHLRDESCSLKDNSVSQSPKPRLRSNSYTLESHSPLLLEHFKKQADSQLSDSDISEKCYLEPQQKTVSFENSKRNWSSLDNSMFLVDINNPQCLENAVQRTDNLNNHMHINVISSSVKCDVMGIQNDAKDAGQGDMCNPYITLENSRINGEDDSEHMLFEKIQLNKTEDPNILDYCEKSQFEVHDCLNGAENESNSNDDGFHKTNKSFESDTQQLNCTEEQSNLATELGNPLKLTPEDYTKLILNYLVIHKQKAEECKENQNKSLLKTNASSCSDCNITCDQVQYASNNTESQDIAKAEYNDSSMNFDPLASAANANEISPRSARNCESTHQMSSQSLYYDTSSPTDSSHAVNTPTGILIDLDSDVSGSAASFGGKTAQCKKINFNLNQHMNHEHNGYTEKEPAAVIKSIEKCFNREVSPRKPNKQQRQLEEQWAATILGAAAKGYLVRRLMRTERVQSLIQTIKDVLVCAMSLHSETRDNIQPADVELHRRLIQQLWAACNAFYDVFFSLSIIEQMGIIALDRQRQLDKLNRQSHGTSARALDFSKSTPTTRKRVVSSKQRTA